jgi:ABC-type amino acid transport system permease subunit/DNA polymerase III delta prime subunit
MTFPEDLKQILNRVEKGQQTDEDITVLRQRLLAGDRQTAQQLGKYNVNIGQGENIQIGDRIYQGVDTEAIEQELRLVLQEKQKAERPPNEKKLLQAVKDEVVARLKQSLHNAALINLGMEAQPEQVKRPWSSDIKIGDKPSEPIPDNQSILEVFDQEEIAGKLLILGNPGAGKTTTMLDLAKALIARAEQDADYPIPVLFNLSTWKDDKQSLRDWLVAELKSKYGVRKDIGAKWVSDAKLLPMLDGLDELKSVRQKPSVKKINEWLDSDYRPQYLVVCSRLEEYEKVLQEEEWEQDAEQELEEIFPRQKIRLFLNGSILLKPFTNEQIQAYLEGINQTKLWEKLQSDTEVRDLVRIPIFLSILGFILLFNIFDFTSLKKLVNSREARLKYLLDNYWEACMKREIVPPSMELKGLKSRTYEEKNFPTKRQVQKWLVYLAQQLQKQSQTEFLIEKIQPYWLLNEFEERVYNLAIRLTVGLVSGLTAGLYLGGWSHESIVLLFAIFSGVVTGVMSYILASILEHFSKFYVKILSGVLPGLGFFVMTYSFSLTASISLKDWSFLVLLTGIGVGVVFYGLVPQEIKPAEKFEISPNRAVKYASFALLFGLIFVPIHFAIQPEKYQKNPLYGLYELLCFVLFGIGVGVIPAREVMIERKRHPNQGIWRTRNYAVIWFLGGGFAAGIFTAAMDGPEVVRTTGIALSVGFLASLIGSSWSGLVCLQHFTIRFILYCKGYIPWNYTRLLDYCTERLLLQRVGGRYRFIHKLIQEHFAAMPLEK